MITRRILSVLFLVTLALSVSACSDDDVKDIVEYNLTIHNNTDTSYDVWIDNPLGTGGFYHAGHVAAHQMTIIHELDIGIHYTVHLTDVDADAEPAVHERTVTSDSADVSWTVN